MGTSAVAQPDGRLVPADDGADPVHQSWLVLDSSVQDCSLDLSEGQAAENFALADHCRVHFRCTSFGMDANEK